MDIKMRSAAAVCSLAILLGYTSGINNVGASIITPGPGNVPGDENVLFNDDLILTGPVVQGITNNTGFIVNFTGDGEELTASGGQARIRATDGSLDFLCIELIDGIFTSLVLNLNAAADGFVQFTIDEVGLGPMDSIEFELDQTGENFFIITSDVGFESICFTTDVSVSIGLDDVRQVRIGGATAVIPEPATIAVWGMLALVGACGAKKYWKVA